MVDNPVPPPPNDNVQRFLPNDLGLAIVAPQTHVSASVLLNANFAAFGALIFTGASIGRDLLCQHAELHSPGRSALYAKDIEIGDDLKLWESSAWATCGSSAPAVTGSVNWRNLTLAGTQTRTRSWRRPARRRQDLPRHRYPTGTSHGGDIPSGPLAGCAPSGPPARA